MCAQTLQYLQQNAKERAELAAAAAAGSGSGFSAPAAASKMSMQELEELRKQLGSVATGSTVQQVPSSARGGSEHETPVGASHMWTGTRDSGSPEEQGTSDHPGQSLTPAGHRGGSANANHSSPFPSVFDNLSSEDCTL